MAYDNMNSGLLSVNERKQQENHPDYSGQCEIGNPPIQYWISGWKKTGKEGSKMAGKKFLSLSFKPKEQQAPKPPPATNEPAFCEAPADDGF